MKHCKTIWTSLIALLLALSMTGCVVQHNQRQSSEDGDDIVGAGSGDLGDGGSGDTPGEDDTGDPDSPAGNDPADPAEKPFTVSLKLGGVPYVPSEPISAQWTDGYSFYSAPFDETGVASITGLDGDFRVTLSSVPAGCVYNPNIYQATNDQRDVVVEMQRLIATAGSGSDLYENIINLYDVGLYQTAKIAPDKIGRIPTYYYQFVPQKAGVYSIETWVDVVEDNVNPTLKIYNGSVAYKVFAYDLDDGGTEGVYTKNVRYEVKIAEEQIGSVFAFGIKATSKDGKYPIQIPFSLEYNGGYTMDHTKYTMILPQELDRPYDRTVTEGNGYTFTYPEVDMGSYSILDGSMFKLNPDDGFYHLYDAETDTYGPVLYADITIPCRFIDRAFNMIEQENKALTISNGTECYKLFIEGWGGLEKVGYDTSWQAGLTQTELMAYRSCGGYSSIANADGRCPVTQELKDFLQKFSISQLYFRDGEGYVETDPETPVDAFEEDQWLFACGYYVKN
ncbi:MAG: hypothetical protein IJW30_03670 [Clostridia bacterium]|nr:hypothetical protein [Clostridia bacterium]